LSFCSQPPPQPTTAEFFQHLSKRVDKVLTRPSAFPSTHPVTAIERKSFKADPFANVGMNGGVMSEVAELGSPVWYEVQFERCAADLIQIDQKEMMTMVEDSVILMARSISI
jgi:hypothetical protein